jgi:hypothetical protein
LQGYREGKPMMFFVLTPAWGVASHFLGLTPIQAVLSLPAVLLAACSVKLSVLEGDLVIKPFILVLACGCGVLVHSMGLSPFLSVFAAVASLFIAANILRAVLCSQLLHLLLQVRRKRLHDRMEQLDA